MAVDGVCAIGRIHDCMEAFIAAGMYVCGYVCMYHHTGVEAFTATCMYACVHVGM